MRGKGGQGGRRKGKRKEGKEGKDGKDNVCRHAFFARSHLRLQAVSLSRVESRMLLSFRRRVRTIRERINAWFGHLRDA